MAGNNESRTGDFNESNSMISTHKETGFDLENAHLNSFRLHEDIWNKWFYVIGPLAAVLQWVLVVPLAVQNNVLTSTSKGFESIGLQSGVAPTGFLNDFFFIAWNIFPIVLLIIYIFFDKIASQWIKDIANNVDTTDSASKIKFVRKIKFNSIVYYAVILIGIIGMAVQIPKQLGFFQSLSQLYWWDWRVSPAIFIIRDIALFFNVVTVTIVYWNTLLSSIEIIVSVKYGDVIPQVFHPDLTGGLMPYGNAISILILPWIVGTFLGLLGFFDHTAEAEILFRIADVFIIVVGTTVALFFFIYSLWVVKKDIGGDIERIQKNIHLLSDQDNLGKEITEENPENLTNRDPIDHKLANSAPLILVRQRIDNMNPWPINDQRVFQVILLISSPVVTVVGRTLTRLANNYWF